MAKKKEFKVTKSLHAPVHPGKILKDEVIDTLGLTVTEAAKRLDIDRITLSRVINGKAAISVEMALRLSKALRTTPDVWLGMQQAYDVWHAKRDHTLDLSRVQRFESGEHAAI